MTKPDSGGRKKRQLILGVGAMVLAASMAIPRLMGGDDVVIPADEVAPSESDLFSGSSSEELEPDELGEPGAEESGRLARLVADLLAEHGSADLSQPVPDPFRKPVREVDSVAVPATEDTTASNDPVAESALERLAAVLDGPARPVDSSEGEPAEDEAKESEVQDASKREGTSEGEPEQVLPSAHLVSLIYLTDNVLRAIVDGRVVGVGSEVGKGRVKAIHPEGIILGVDGDTVLYALGSADPLLHDSATGDLVWKTRPRPVTQRVASEAPAGDGP